jgi:hypothetical protein
MGVIRWKDSQRLLTAQNEKTPAYFNGIIYNGNTYPQIEITKPILGVQNVIRGRGSKSPTPTPCAYFFIAHRIYHFPTP